MVVHNSVFLNLRFKNIDKRDIRIFMRETDGLYLHLHLMLH